MKCEYCGTEIIGEIMLSLIYTKIQFIENDNEKYHPWCYKLIMLEEKINEIIDDLENLKSRSKNVERNCGNKHRI